MSNSPHGDLLNADISNCQMGIQYVTGQGVDVLHCNIYDCLDAINTTSYSAVQFEESSISGINYDVNANGASVDFILLNSIWSGDPGKLNINNGQVIVKNMRPEPPRRVYDDYVRKPLQENLFNVKKYGAIGNSVSDDTSAIVAAVAAANANGGGIVFFPSGDYLIKQNLTLSPGVELRGCLGGRVQIESGSVGSTLRIDVPVGDEDGPAFITMGDYCGIRGLAFYYPNQD
ncbi:MAG: hypothetical protein HC901_02265, partial [Bdellovibrionaceae bacterium]|nr:hypothetical protein [Pseudobdellovibrionaceae bacterium]